MAEFDQGILTGETLDLQRAMRSNLEGAQKDGAIGVIDIGSTKVACIVVEFDDGQEQGGNREISSKGQMDFKVVGAHATKSRGISFGEIDSVRNTEKDVRKAVSEAQQMANRNVDIFVVCLSGARPKSQLTSGAISLGEKPVDGTDIAQAMASCEFPEFDASRELLHAQPINFGVDHRLSLNDPRQLIGNSLEVDMHLLSVDSSAIENLIGCTSRCQLNLAGITTSAYMSGIACLVEDEQEIGGACVDIGGGTTSISIFFKKNMIYTATVPVGGRTITSDLSQIFGISFNAAENLKVRKGGAVATQRDDWDMCELGSGVDGKAHDQEIEKITRTELIGVIRPRVEEILEIINSKLEEVNFFDELPGNRIVLTGGCSEMPGLDLLSRQILGKHIRFGLPIRVRGLPTKMTGPAYSAAVGLCLHAAHPDDELWDFKLPNEVIGGTSIGRAFRWLRRQW